MYHESRPNNNAQLHPYRDADYLLGLLLVHGFLSAEDFARLKDKASLHASEGHDLVQWLSSQGIPQRNAPGAAIDEADILGLVARDRGWAFRRLDPLKLDSEVVSRTLPASFCKRRLVLPLRWDQDVLEIACYDPVDPELQQDLERACKAKTRTVVAPRRDIERAIRECLDFKRSIAAAENVLKAPSVDISNLEQYVKLASSDASSSDRFVQKAVDHLFQYALDQRASDIHVEPKRNESVVRLRIDGILHTVYRLPKVVHDAMCSRIKALSRLDIAERRRPQDGRLKVAWEGEEAEVRVSTVPVAFGEKMVLRLQSAQVLFSDLEELGFSPRDLETYKGFLKNDHGMILMTGPTGSGKSTTLYSTLRHLSTPEVNIVTVEDPIEMVYEEFNQIAVQPQVDVTFASILRNILRQDPDIVMIGEIRDEETARYAVQAALTGHLVFSTLHTNDSAGAVVRLRDLGLESYLISSTLVGVVAQRLVRKVCKWCKEEVEIPARELRALGIEPDADPVTGARGRGCSRCRNTGYWGRIGVYEVFSVSDELRAMIYSGADSMVLEKQAMKEGMTPLKLDAARKFMSGITTLEEVIKVVSS